EGGTTGADRSLHAAVLLPGEANGPLFQIAPQPPEAMMIDTLNVYDDGSKADQTGTLTSTAITGLGMVTAKLDFTQQPGNNPLPFGEPGVYPGGISYGAISLDGNGNFTTDGGRTTIDVLNILLGSGNDHFTVQNTMVPGPDHNADGSLGKVAAHGGITAVHGGGNSLLQLADGAFETHPANPGDPAGTTGRLVRADGVTWADFGFAVGQQVVLTGGVAGTFTVTGFANSSNLPGHVGDVLLLGGASSLTNQLNVTATISVTDYLQVTGLFD